MRYPLAAALTFGLSMLIALGALAAYVGPDRAVEEQVPDPENDLWTLTHEPSPDQEADTCQKQQPCELAPTEDQ